MKLNADQSALLAALARRGFQDEEEARRLLAKGAKNATGDVIALSDAQIDAVLSSPEDYGFTLPA